MASNIALVLLSVFALSINAGPIESPQDSNIFLNDMRFVDSE
ncbi:unnamed protein product, partial [Allacma fusca]